jgi:serine acetyltransferase
VRTEIDPTVLHGWAWGFFIDHETGFVIGETAVIERRVRLSRGQAWRLSL